MSTLRAQIVRLAHANPELRPHLLPLLVDKAAGAQGTYHDEVGFRIRVDIDKIAPGATGFYLWYVEGRASLQDKESGKQFTWPLRVNVGENDFLSNLPLQIGTADVKMLGELVEASVQKYAKSCVLDAVVGRK